VGGKEEGEPEERQGGKVDNGTAYTHSVFNWIAAKYGELRERNEKKKNLSQLLVYRYVQKSPTLSHWQRKKRPTTFITNNDEKIFKKVSVSLPFYFVGQHREREREMDKTWFDNIVVYELTINERRSFSRAPPPARERGGGREYLSQSSQTNDGDCGPPSIRFTYSPSAMNYAL
jgi:hypothetical protein